jgi:hypothetical protein
MIGKAFSKYLIQIHAKDKETSLREGWILNDRPWHSYWPPQMSEGFSTVTYRPMHVW